MECALWELKLYPGKRSFFFFIICLDNTRRQHALRETQPIKQVQSLLMFPVKVLDPADSFKNVFSDLEM